MYTTTNFKSKKALKDAVAGGKTIGVYQPNDMFGNPKASPEFSGTAAVEGPHYPAAHTWYSTVTIEKGKIIAVK
jgi:hypothetical protein